VNYTDPIAPALTVPTEFAFHDYGTGERLSMRMPTLQPYGNPIELYRLATGLYCTGDSNAWILSAAQFRQFMEMQALGHYLPVGFLSLFASKEAVSPWKFRTPKDALLDRIRARKDAIQSRTGVLSESYPLIRAARRRR